MVILHILASLVLLYIVFIILPAIVISLMVFAPQCVPECEKADWANTYYKAYADDIISGKAALIKKPHTQRRITAFDGINLDCDYYENGENLVVFFHGYRSDPYFCFSLQANALYESGFSVAIVYERAQNGHEGKHVGLGLLEYRDVISWCEYFSREKHVSVYGTSMGATAIMYAIDKLNVRSAVVDCGFVGVRAQIVRDSLRRNLPINMLMPYIRLTLRLFCKFDVNKSVSQALGGCKIPVLFMHGEADSSVPVSDTRENYKSCASENKKIITVENAEHTLSFASGGETVQNEVLAFLIKNSEVISI